MSVKSVPCYYVECDGCRAVSTDDTEPTCWPDEQSAIAEAIDCGWTVDHDGRWLCEECRNSDDTDTTINGVVPGSGQCVVADCGRPTPTGRLMCHEHWRQVPEMERADLRAVWHHWHLGAIPLRDLRLAQRRCIEAIQ